MTLMRVKNQHLSNGAPSPNSKPSASIVGILNVGNNLWTRSHKGWSFINCDKKLNSSCEWPSPFSDWPTQLVLASDWLDVDLIWQCNVWNIGAHKLFIEIDITNIFVSGHNTYEEVINFKKLDRMVDRVKPWFMVHGFVHGSVYGSFHGSVHSSHWTPGMTCDWMCLS